MPSQFRMLKIIALKKMIWNYPISDNSIDFNDSVTLICPGHMQGHSQGGSLGSEEPTS